MFSSMSVFLAEPILGKKGKKTTIYTTVDYKAKIQNIVLIYKNANICAMSANSV